MHLLMETATGLELMHTREAVAALDHFEAGFSLLEVEGGLGRIEETTETEIAMPASTIKGRLMRAHESLRRTV